MMNKTEAYKRQVKILERVATVRRTAAELLEMLTRKEYYRGIEEDIRACEIELEDLKAEFTEMRWIQETENN